MSRVMRVLVVVGAVLYIFNLFIECLMDKYGFFTFSDLYVRFSRISVSVFPVKVINKR